MATSSAARCKLAEVLSDIENEIDWLVDWLIDSLVDIDVDKLLDIEDEMDWLIDLDIDKAFAASLAIFSLILIDSDIDLLTEIEACLAVYSGSDST